MYYLMDLERTILTKITHYWKRNRHGYTPYIEEAGLFPEDEVIKIFKSDFDKRTVMIPEETVEGILKGI